LALGPFRYPYTGLSSHDALAWFFVKNARNIWIYTEVNLKKCSIKSACNSFTVYFYKHMLSVLRQESFIPF